MKTENLNPGWGGVLRGLMFMRIRELVTASTITRMAILFGVVFGLTLFIGAKTNGKAFWPVASNFFALGFVPFYCIVKGAESMRTELRDGTIEYLWTRPTRKARLFLGFYLSSLASALLVTFTCVVAIVATGLIVGEIESLAQAAVYGLGCGALAISFCALSMTIGSFTSKYIVMGIVYHAFVERVVSQLPTSVRHFSILGNIKPYFESLQDPSSSAGYVASLQPAINIGLIAAVALAIGGLAFTWKNYAFGSDK